MVLIPERARLSYVPMGAQVKPNFEIKKKTSTAGVSVMHNTTSETIS